MDPSVWGPALWACAFECTVKLTYNQSLVLFDSMQYFIPCVHCRESYAMFYRKMQPYHGSATKWLWTVHDMVNQKLRKPFMPFSHLESRLTAFPNSLSGSLFYDLLILLYMHSDSEHADPQSGAMVSRALPLFKLAIRPRALGAFLTEPRTPASGWKHVLSCKNKMLESVGEPVQSEADALAQFSPCTAPPLTRAVAKDRLGRARGAPRPARRSAAL